MGSVTDLVAGAVAPARTRKSWLLMLLVTFAGVGVLFVSVLWLFSEYVGIWGIEIPVAWGIAIASFVWWIGIGHAGTLISAVLLLAKQPWRRSINRFAEAMTLFAVACAGLYPILHLGRPEHFYWLVPYPSTYGAWPQFGSPLVWDLFAISTYLTVSLLFWYLGLIPDLATMRDRATGLKAKVYGVFALGWRGDARHWARHQRGYLMLGGLATPLVVSVHTVVSFDFAVAQLPGWHMTMFPPYFVAGAIYSGFAMVLTLVIPARRWLRLTDVITDDHLDAAAKLMLASGLIVAYGYASEIFFGWYSGDPSELSLVHSHLAGHSAPLFWTVVTLNVGSAMFLWSRRVRRSVVPLFVLTLLINVGMWLERYLIVIGSLEHGFLPSTKGEYTATFWDWSTFLGTLAFFGFLMLLFVRFVPAVAMAELREMVPPRRALRPPPPPAGPEVTP
ncbi:MAG: polysulfide reductase NrfD [Deltaproteobacteria bacterium]|nr:polysulfide reductase NrfD [Deltaproteobacteria bacterium]